MGVSSPIQVGRTGDAGSIEVTVDITHTWINDLIVTLVAPDGSTFTLHNREGGSTNNIHMTYLKDARGVESAGTWTLHVVDKAGADVGTIDSWTITF